MTAETVISPELVLVDPELAAVARARIPAPIEPRQRPPHPVESASPRLPRSVAVLLLAGLFALGLFAAPVGRRIAHVPAVAQPRAGAGYVFGHGGRLQVSADAGTVVGLTLPRVCGADVPLPPLAIVRGRAFRFDGTVAASGDRVGIVLAGLFTDASHARITAHVVRGSCSTGPVRYDARLS